MPSINAFACRRCGTLRTTDSAAKIVERGVEEDVAGYEDDGVLMSPECPCGFEAFRRVKLGDADE